MNSQNFYSQLKPLNLPVAEIFEEGNFSDVPRDWQVIVADVQDSTAAVVSGKHNDVNLVAAGSIIVALNIAKARQIEIPFFFGGDGGILLVPSSLLNPILAGLRLHRENVLKNFGLSMHIGSTAVSDVVDAGHPIMISKSHTGISLTRALAIGDGLLYAEKIIKQSRGTIADRTMRGELNLEGLECRWDRVKPPAEDNEIVCYIIEATQPAQQLKVYRDVLQKIDAIYGDLADRNPLSPSGLKLLVGWNKLKKEMLARYGKWKIVHFAGTYIQTLLGLLYFKYDLTINNLSGHAYLNQLVSNADTLTIDGRINTIISGKKDKRIQFINYLLDEEKGGNLVFGHHISKESIITCYIENRNSNHIHFVDGSDGGYTEAAREFKAKLSRRR